MRKVMPLLYYVGSWHDPKEYLVIVEKKIALSFNGVLSPVQCVSSWFAFFYVMNMKYPPGILATSEYIQW
jgi:hypothetical protein